ncbi:MAG: hypothetical protein JW870_21495 [Candidatus Delongbacteria bacterium]|nr:hypothetical protein [Candidatus Delongbacteria bacterium]
MCYCVYGCYYANSGGSSNYDNGQVNYSLGVNSKSGYEFGPDGPIL